MSAWEKNQVIRKEAESFTLDFWLDEGWYVGKFREVPGVFSQGKSFEALKENIRDAYELMVCETM